MYHISEIKKNISVLKYDKTGQNFKNIYDSSKKSCSYKKMSVHYKLT